MVETIEYKLSLADLVADLHSEKKDFKDISLAIAWDKGNAFEDHFPDYDLTKLLEFPKDLPDRRYPGQTHELRSATDSGVIAVMLLADLFEAVAR